VGHYAAYILPYVPDTLPLYVVYPNGDTYTSHADIDAIFQKRPTHSFSVGCLEFIYHPKGSELDKKYIYVVKWGELSLVLRIYCVDADRTCGPW
jgi:hypothetical protein